MLAPTAKMVSSQGKSVKPLGTQLLISVGKKSDRDRSSNISSSDDESSPRSRLDPNIDLLLVLRVIGMAL